MRRLAHSSFVLGAACRLMGCLATLLLLRVELGRGLESPLPLAVMQIALACVVAVLIGNVVKELAFALSERVMNGLGLPFYRVIRTLSGRVLSETYLPNGTWVRCETWKGGAALEWTDPDGGCSRVESPSMTVMRSIPIRSGDRPMCMVGTVLADRSRAGHCRFVRG